MISDHSEIPTVPAFPGIVSRPGSQNTGMPWRARRLGQLPVRDCGGCGGICEGSKHCTRVPATETRRTNDEGQSSSIASKRRLDVPNAAACVNTMCSCLHRALIISSIAHVRHERAQAQFSPASLRVLRALGDRWTLPGQATQGDFRTHLRDCGDEDGDGDLPSKPRGDMGIEYGKPPK